MRKGTLILSLVLTAVVLALLARLVSIYGKTIETAVPTDAPQVQEQPQSQPAELSSPNPAAGPVTIFDAAVIAVDVLGHNDVYLAEYAQFNGANAYLVTFLSGDLVYVNLDGQVVSAAKQDPVNPFQPTSHR